MRLVGKAFYVPDGGKIGRGRGDQDDTGHEQREVDGGHIGTYNKRLEEEYPEKSSRRTRSSPTRVICLIQS